jgi:hypothetical protein
MDDETFNMSLRKFLKTVGVNSQREIEQAVARGIESQRINGTESFPVKMRLTGEGLELDVTFDGEIRLE